MSNKTAAMLRKTAIEVPFRVALQEAEHATTGDGLECQRILRLLPGRRVVCLASRGDHHSVAKFFIHPHKAQRDFEREVRGYEYLRAAGITTPTLITQASADGALVVLYQYIDNSVSLEQLLPATANDNAQKIINEIMTIVAVMHNSGVLQIDLHLNNFIYSDKLYTIDCGDIAALSSGKGKRLAQIHTNIADLLSQLPTCYDPLLNEFISSYRQQAKLATQISETKIKREILRWRRWRMKNYVKKGARTCSEFIAEKSWRQFRVYRRAYSSPEWLSCYAKLDQLVEQSPRLKDGNTATVALSECAGRKIVIKRYNIKSFRHLLSRFWRPSRAWRSWQNALRLQVLGIRTPQPIAVIEKRRGWLRSQAFYISVYDDAEDALNTYNTPQQQISVQQLRAFEQLFTTMLYARISHGDLKGNNLLIDTDALAVIDLDAMRFHRFAFTFKGAFAKDMRRFLHNWPENSTMHTQLQQMVRSLTE